MTPIISDDAQHTPTGPGLRMTTTALALALALVSAPAARAARPPRPLAPLTPLRTRLETGRDGRYGTYLRGSRLTDLGTGPRAPGAGARSVITTWYANRAVVISPDGGRHTILY